MSVIQFDQDWYTPKEVAAILKTTPVTAAKIFRGQRGVIDISAEKPQTRDRRHTRQHLRISKEALERLIRERSTQKASLGSVKRFSGGGQ
jgi:hypothetical protein